MASSHRSGATPARWPVVVGVLVVLAVAAGVTVLAMRMVAGSSDPAKPIGSADGAVAAVDVRSTVAVIEQCFAAGGQYPAQLDPAGVFAGCGQRASLSPGSTIAYFSSGSGYILAVTNTSAGVTGKTYCYASTQGTVSTIAAPLTGYRSSC